MEARFPADYPSSPFKLRVVTPRIAYLCGHVTVGGSICIEALTLSGSDSSWRPTFTFESLLATVLSNMMHCEAVRVTTATGVGGISGPLRVDMQNRHVCAEYSVDEADMAFQRTLQNHGWASNRGGGVGGSNPRAAPVAVPRPAPPINRQHAYAAAAFQHHPGRHQLPAGQSASPTKKLHPFPWDSSYTRNLGSLPTQPAPPPKLPQKHHSRKRPTEVIDLTSVGDDDDGDLSIASPRRAGPSKRSKPVTTNRNTTTSKAAYDIVINSEASEVIERAAPTVEERLAAANAKTGLHLLPPPSHWEITEEVLLGQPVFVELPLPDGMGNAAMVAGDSMQWGGHEKNDALLLQQNGFSQAEAIQALNDAHGDVQLAIEQFIGRGGIGDGGSGDGGYSEDDVQEMMLNEISREDAEAALEISGGDVGAALLVCLDCRESGSTLATALQQHRQQNQQHAVVAATLAQKKAKEADQARKAREEKQQRAELQREAQSVLRRFSEHQGLTSNRIVRIERVQNLLLWTEYERLKRRILETTQGNLNERRLWHGAHQDVLSTICCKEGFDVRVSNLAGALGAGVYFANKSSYSDAYSKAAPRSAVPGSAHMSVAMIAPGGGMMALPPPPPPPPPPRHHQQEQHHYRNHGQKPRFVNNHVAMLLCDVALGFSAPGAPMLRRPPDGYHSTSAAGIWAVYDNRQAYPAYVVHYK